MSRPAQYTDPLTHEAANMQVLVATQTYIITKSVVVQLSFEGCFCFEIVFDGFKDRLHPFTIFSAPLACSQHS